MIAIYVYGICFGIIIGGLLGIRWGLTLGKQHGMDT